MIDPFNLERFVAAQRGVYERVETELGAGSKMSHWMWFIFPQLAGLGQSEMAKKYAISSLAEARAYLAHPVLGPRLQSCTRLVLQIERRTAQEIFGYPDDMKFCSSMTLFARADPDMTLFERALQKHFSGKCDLQTVELLQQA